MNADAFRQWYGYHFAVNRKIWEAYIVPLPMEQFLQESAYSMGSVRNQLAHMMNVDQAWFSQLGAIANPVFLEAEDYDTKEKLRQDWDRIVADMQAYLDNLRDDMLFEHVPDDDTDQMNVWRVLIHVVNHGTDHRAQTLALLHSLGVGTKPQDYVFYKWGKL